MREPDPFRCEVRETDAGAVVALFGELDLATVSEAEQALNAQARSKRHVTVDLRGLSFMDCSGVRMLLSVDAASRADGFGFSVVPGDEHAMLVLEASGVVDQLVIADAPEHVRV